MTWKGNLALFAAMFVVFFALTGGLEDLLLLVFRRANP